MLEKYLQEIGLNEKEASVYVALLQSGDASVIDLASKTKINRSTTYTVLESLAKKGLVSEVVAGKKTRYQAESPEKLGNFVEGQKAILEERSKRLKDIIPEIKNAQRSAGEKPMIQYFEGKDGILALNESMRDGGEKTDKDAVHAIYPQDTLDEIFPDDEQSELFHARLGQGTKSRSVYTWSKGTKISDEMSETVKLDGDRYPISCEIAVSGDKVGISLLGNKLSAIFIRSRDLADTLKSVLNALSDGSKK